MIDLTEEDIMKNWNEKYGSVPVVSIRCIAYKQENYVAQTIEGFLKQKTTFPFEIVIHDDASPDKTAEIIRLYEKKYPTIIHALYETENQYSKPGKPLGDIVNAALRGKYIAWCEGDDYWIDDNKLQMQVMFLESHLDYGMCYTQSYSYIQSKNQLVKKANGKKIKSYADIFVNGNKIPTLTVCMRHDIYKEYLMDVKPKEKNWAMGDLPMWLWIYKESKIKFFRKKTSVYRVLSESASHSSDERKINRFNESSYNIRKYFSEKYNDAVLLKQYEMVVNFFKAYKDDKRKDLRNIYFCLPRIAKTAKNRVIFIFSLTNYSFKIIRRFV